MLPNGQCVTMSVVRACRSGRLCVKVLLKQIVLAPSLWLRRLVTAQMGVVGKLVLGLHVHQTVVLDFRPALCRAKEIVWGKAQVKCRSAIAPIAAVGSRQLGATVVSSVEMEFSGELFHASVVMTMIAPTCHDLPTCVSVTLQIAIGLCQVGHCAVLYVGWVRSREQLHVPADMTQIVSPMIDLILYSRAWQSKRVHGRPQLGGLALKFAAKESSTAMYGVRQVQKVSALVTSLATYRVVPSIGAAIGQSVNGQSVAHNAATVCSNARPPALSMYQAHVQNPSHRRSSHVAK